MTAPCIVPLDGPRDARLERPVRYIRSHAALRGVAALLVVAYHLQFGASHRLAIETATPFFERGYLLVDLFFILSGFVISLTSDADRTRPFTGQEVRQFYAARVARIYPLHLFCLCFVVAATLALAQLRQWHHPGAPAPWIDAGAARSLVAELFLVQAWIPGAPHWNIPSWSISAELVAYAAFPLILVLRARLPRLAPWLLAFLPLAFYLSVLLGSGSLDIIAGLAPLRCLGGFMIGIILYDLRHATASWSDGMVAGCQLVAVAGIVAVLATRCPDPVVIPPFALLVIATWQDRGPVPRLLRHRVFSRSGELSYSIYLTHVCLIGIIVPLWYSLMARVGLRDDMSRIALIAVCVAAVLMASQWTYAHVEQTGRRRLRQLFSRPARR